jgi:hypothetical protein
MVATKNQQSFCTYACLEFYYLWWLEDGQSCYLETHNFRNVAYYEKYGFKTMEIGLLPGTNTEHFAMLREAK